MPSFSAALCGFSLRQPECAALFFSYDYPDQRREAHRACHHRREQEHYVLRLRRAAHRPVQSGRTIPLHQCAGHHARGSPAGPACEGLVLSELRRGQHSHHCRDEIPSRLRIGRFLRHDARGTDAPFLHHGRAARHSAVFLPAGTGFSADCAPSVFPAHPVSDGSPVRPRRFSGTGRFRPVSEDQHRKMPGDRGARAFLQRHVGAHRPTCQRQPDRLTE